MLPANKIRIELEIRERIAIQTGKTATFERKKNLKALWTLEKNDQLKVTKEDIRMPTSTSWKKRRAAIVRYGNEKQKSSRRRLLE